MNFLDLYDSLSPEDRDKLMGNFLKNLKGEPTEPILSRITFKISNLGSEEEIQQRIADVLGVSIEDVPPSNARAEIDRNRANWLKVCDVTQSYKKLLESNPNTTPDKFEELTDLGRFVVALPEKIEISTKDPFINYPDFIVKATDNYIGIEHTRLINPKLKAMFQEAKKYINLAHKKIIKKDNSLSGTVNIFINYGQIVINGKDFNSRGFTVPEKKQISSLIAEYIESEIKGSGFPKPSFIEKITHTSNLEPRLDLILAEKYIAKDGFIELVNSRILEKEARFEDYIKESAVDKCWLLIVIDGISSFSGFDLETENMNFITSNKFDKVVLFESFGSKIRYL